MTVTLVGFVSVFVGIVSTLVRIVSVFVGIVSTLVRIVPIFVRIVPVFVRKVSTLVGIVPMGFMIVMTVPLVDFTHFSFMMIPLFLHLLLHLMLAGIVLSADLVHFPLMALIFGTKGAVVFVVMVHVAFMMYCRF